METSWVRHSFDQTSLFPIGIHNTKTFTIFKILNIIRILKSLSNRLISCTKQSPADGQALPTEACHDQDLP